MRSTQIQNSSNACCRNSSRITRDGNDGIMILPSVCSGKRDMTMEWSSTSLAVKRKISCAVHRVIAQASTLICGLMPRPLLKWHNAWGKSKRHKSTNLLPMRCERPRWRNCGIRNGNSFFRCLKTMRTAMVTTSPPERSFTKKVDSRVIPTAAN